MIEIKECAKNFQKMIYDTDARNIKDLIEMAADVFPISVIEWLDVRGYFSAPAAKDHHGNHPGGLYEHSKAVAKELSELTAKLNLSWGRPESPIIIGMLHDLCKIEDYVITEDEKSQYTISYAKKHYPGHGENSVRLCEQLMRQCPDFTLTEEEEMCIRFHMGAFTDKTEWKYYTAAVKEYNNVLYTHTADMIASQILEQ